MSGWERYERLARLAADEPTPLPDVRAAVLARLRTETVVVTAPRWQTAWLGACAVAAGVLLLMGYQSYQALGNPWLGWLGMAEGGWLL